MAKSVLAVGILALCSVAQASPTPVPSWASMPTGNGFGFSVFDAGAKKVTTFLERPYKYLGPGATQQDTGVYRRDLAYDVYFGARVNGTDAAWMPNIAQSSAGYVNQTGIVQSTAQVDTVQIQSFFWEPFGLQQNALVMVAQATNSGSGPVTLDLFALPNFHLGGPDPDNDNPSPDGETITTTGNLSFESGMLGESGGSMVYMPLGAIVKADCAGDGYDAVNAGGDLPQDTRSCMGDDKTIIFQSSQLTIAPGATESFGLIIGFSPTISGAAAVGTALTTWVGTRTPDKILSDAQSEWTTWRKPLPTGLSDDETRIYRQAETTLRMAQVMEPWSPTLTNHGMILAALPPGTWHIGWVRDATYAIVALAQMGHIDEAKDGLRFFLAAQANQYKTYTNGDYRISVCRYFGNGLEESDWNSDGPNIEFDGWGLYLWALRQTLDAAGETSLLQETLPTKEKFIDVVRSGVQGAIQQNIESSGLMLPDTSIWESHWNNRAHYAFTSMANARGLCDLAEIESKAGDPTRAPKLVSESTALRAAIRATMLDQKLLLGGTEEGVANGKYHDGAVLEAFNWELYPSSDPLYPATLSGDDAVLSTGSTGWMRNDNNGGTYDTNEWIFIDMRAATAFRRMGNSTRSDSLIAWVTQQARANYDLIPELFNTASSDGTLWSYTGAVPMVGFGAGAYVLALRQRAGQVESHDCGPAAASDAGVVVANDMGVTPQGGGCGCAIGARTHVPCSTLALLLFAAFGVLVIAQRRAARRR